MNSATHLKGLPSLRHLARLLVASGVGVIVAWLSPWPLRPVTRALVGWNTGVYLYLALVVWMMLQSHVGSIRARARHEDERVRVLMPLVSVGALMSLLAIVYELAFSSEGGTPSSLGRLTLAVLTVTGNWLLLPTAFGLHYAHAYYLAPPGHPPVEFADQEPEPDYWDFLYLSFTIAVAAQTSDVMIKSRTMRRTVLAQSLLAFVLNTAVVALTINIAAGLLQRH